jgi:hypothetical protein
MLLQICGKHIHRTTAVVRLDGVKGAIATLLTRSAKAAPRRGSDSCSDSLACAALGHVGARQQAPGGGMDEGGSSEVGKRLNLGSRGRAVTSNLSV